MLAGQWGRHLGARMIGVAAGEEKVKLALANGYEYCLDRLKDDIPARVKEITGGAGVPVVYDSVGKNSFDQSLNSLAPRGYFVSFGTTTGSTSAGGGQHASENGISLLHTPHLGNLYSFYRRFTPFSF
jgi:NADPH:quinone reductase